MDERDTGLNGIRHIFRLGTQLSQHVYIGLYMEGRDFTDILVKDLCIIYKVIVWMQIRANMVRDYVRNEDRMFLRRHNI